ncbi:MAG: hypothetical protein GY925_22190 [Actinomycetia bacterium]|nr:hypothetical protein [Actinomycetes bacterium]
MKKAIGVATNDLVERLAAIPLSDVGLAVLFTTLIELEIWLFKPDTNYPAVAAVAALAMGVALASRRVWPFRSLLVNVVAGLIFIALGNPSNLIQWPSLIMVWSIAAYGHRVQQWVGLVLSLAVVAFYFVRIPGQGGVAVFIATVAVWAIVWLVSLLFGARIREEGLAEASSVAEALAVAQQQQLQFEEARTSMARDLHDLIGHTVNLMLVHAEGGRLALDDDPAATRLALDTIVATARQAMTELDLLLETLRRGSESSGREPALGLKDFPRLREELMAAGVEVELRVHGDATQVPGSIGVSAYRIAQAALTNTLRHAGSADVSVDLTVSSSVVSLDISDTGSGLDAGDSEGRGLRGIRERMALHGGDVDIRNRAGGGVQISCRFPVRSA